MRIAVSGAHRTGKTTLVEELRRLLPGYVAIDEPYCLLEEEGHEFAAMPCLEDFELQLDRAIESIVEGANDRIFDRCPADMLAYLFTHRDSARFDFEHWLPRVRSAMELLDLIVFVPIEDADRVPVSEPDHGRLRRNVDEELRDIVLADPWGFGVEALEVTGTAQARARQVLLWVRGGAI